MQSKIIIMILVMIGIIYAAVFTNTGLRLTDSMSSMMSGDEAVVVDLKTLNAGLTEEKLKDRYADLSWQCIDQTSAFGERFCHAQISSLNGIPAYYITVFFKKHVLKAMKMVFSPHFHLEMNTKIREQLGKPSNAGAEVPLNPPPHAVFQWTLKDSAVVVKQALLAGDEAAIMWLNTTRVISQNP